MRPGRSYILLLITVFGAILFIALLITRMDISAKEKYLRAIQISTLESVADAYSEMLGEVDIHIDNKNLKLQLAPDKEDAFYARKYSLPESRISHVFDGLSIDLIESNNVLQSCVDDLRPLIEYRSYQGLVDTIPIGAVATPVANAEASRLGLITVNDTLIRRRIYYASIIFLLLGNMKRICEGKTDEDRQLRLALGRNAYRVSGRVRLFSSLEETRKDNALSLVLEKEMRVLFEKRRDKHLAYGIQLLGNEFLRFVVAHEFGHHVRGHVSPEKKHGIFEREFEADRFAAEVMTDYFEGRTGLVDRAWLIIPAATAFLALSDSKKDLSRIDFRRMLRSYPSWRIRLSYLSEMFAEMGQIVMDDEMDGTLVAVEESFEAIWEELSNNYMLE